MAGSVDGRSKLAGGSCPLVCSEPTPADIGGRTAESVGRGGTGPGSSAGSTGSVVTEPPPKTAAPRATVFFGSLSTAIGRAKRQGHIQQGQIAPYLDSETHALRQRSSGAMDMISKVLDADHDGSVFDELAEMGTQLFSAFESGRA